MPPKLYVRWKNIMCFLATKTIILLYLLISFTNIAVAHTYDSIEYNLNLLNIKDSVLKVEVILRGKFKDKLVVNLPFGWASTTYVD